MINKEHTGLAKEAGASAATRRMSLYPLAYYAAMIVFPLALLAANDSWVFYSTKGWVDYCFYEGYFVNLKSFLNFFPTVYYGTRLPWLTLGAAVHSLATPVAASYILRLVLFYSAEFSLFATARMVWRNNLAAVLAAMLMGSNTYFLWAIGWDYVNGLGLVLISVTVACLTAAASGKAPRLSLFCAGIAFTSMVSTYIALICFAPFQFGGYLALNRWRSRNSLGRSLAWFTSGAAAGVAFFGAVNWWLCGRFLYFLPQLGMARLVGSAPERWKAPNYAWVASATWLVFPAVAVATALILLPVVVFWRRNDKAMSEMRRNTALVSLLMIGIGAFFVITEIKGFWFLQASYFAAFLIPSAFLCIAGALALAAVRLEKWHAATIVAAMLILLIPFLDAPFNSVRPCAPSCVLPGTLGWLAVGGCVVLGTAALFRSGWLGGLALVLFSLSNIATADVNAFSFPPSPVARAHYSMMFDGLRALHRYDSAGDLRFWYDRREPLGGLFESIGWGFLWGRGRVVSEDFPNLADNRYTGAPGEIKGGDRIAIFSSGKDALAAAGGVLEKLGFKYEKLGDTYIQRGAEGFHLDFVLVLRKDVGPRLDMPLTEMRGLQPTALVQEGDGSIGVRTMSPPWTYAAFLKIPGAAQDGATTCGGLVKLNVQVKRGLVGIGVLSATQADFVARRFVAISGRPVDIYLQVPSLDNASGILVQAWDSGMEGFVDVHSASIAPFGCVARAGSGTPPKRVTRPVGR